MWRGCVCMRHIYRNRVPENSYRCVRHFSHATKVNTLFCFSVQSKSDGKMSNTCSRNGLDSNFNTMQVGKKFPNDNLWQLRMQSFPSLDQLLVYFHRICFEIFGIRMFSTIDRYWRLWLSIYTFKFMSKNKFNLRF